MCKVFLRDFTRMRNNGKLGKVIQKTIREIENASMEIAIAIPAGIYIIFVLNLNIVDIGDRVRLAANEQNAIFLLCINLPKWLKPLMRWLLVEL